MFLFEFSLKISRPKTLISPPSRVTRRSQTDISNYDAVLQNLTRVVQRAQDRDYCAVEPVGI